MRLIRACSACAGPLTLKMARCPHCGAAHRAGAVARVVAKVVGVVGGLSITSTLAACYGGPCASGGGTCRTGVPTCDEVSDRPTVDDVDGDGYCLAQDCNEQDPNTNAAAIDIPKDGIDQDCSGGDLGRPRFNGVDLGSR
jgi:hypothetical protein